MNSLEERTMGPVRYGNAAVLVLIAFYFFLIPPAIVVTELSDANLRQPGIPRLAWKLHQRITPKFARWAKQRRESTRATKLATSDISGTEWPLFGSVFYLWSTESLQEVWATNAPSQRLVKEAPAVYARDAIETAIQLVLDPQQASWVKIHWGDKYLETENVFYRMLVIAALTSHARLTGSKEYLPLLKRQVEGLSAELVASPHGLLDDYPAECYPGDVLTAVAMIRKADAVLETDHSAFVQHELRAFQKLSARSRGLVPYSASALTGEEIVPTRGCGNSYVSLFAPSIWPEQARAWYDLYARAFWQTSWTGVGFREFPSDMPGKDWYMDVDSGPVVKGFGFAACAFGVGAARVNGHFEHAYPLATEMLATSWPLAQGTLFFPRFLSNAAEAPYLGEAAILYNLTRLPAPGVTIRTGGSLPFFVPIVLGLQIGVGLLLFLVAIRSVITWRREGDIVVIRCPRTQLIVWVTFLVLATGLLIFGRIHYALIVLLLAQLLPRYQHPTPPKNAGSGVLT